MFHRARCRSQIREERPKKPYDPFFVSFRRILQENSRKWRPFPGTGAPDIRRLVASFGKRAPKNLPKRFSVHSGESYRKTVRNDVHFQILVHQVPKGGGQEGEFCLIWVWILGDDSHMLLLMQFQLHKSSQSVKISEVKCIISSSISCFYELNQSRYYEIQSI